MVALGPEHPRDTGLEQTRSLLELTNVRYVRGSVYDLQSLAPGEGYNPRATAMAERQGIPPG